MRRRAGDQISPGGYLDVMSSHTMLADGIYIGGGVLLVILIVLVLLLILRR